MAYQLFNSQNKALFSDKPIVKATEAKNMASALDVLAEAQRIEAGAEAKIAQATADGFASGQATAIAQMQEYLAEAITPIIAQVAENQSELRRDLGTMAHSAVTQILGAIPDDEKMTAATKHALSRLEIEDVEAIELSANVADIVQSRLPADTGKLVRAVEGKDTGHCIIRTISGSILCSLDLQLETLNNRWGAQEK